MDHSGTGFASALPRFPAISSARRWHLTRIRPLAGLESVRRSTFLPIRSFAI